MCSPLEQHTARKKCEAWFLLAELISTDSFSPEVSQQHFLWNTYCYQKFTKCSSWKSMERLCFWIGSTQLWHCILHWNVACGKGRTLLDTIRPPHLSKWRWWTSGSGDLHIPKFLQTNPKYSFPCIFFKNWVFALWYCRCKICCHCLLHANQLGYGRGSWGSLFVVGHAHPECRTHQCNYCPRRRLQCVHWRARGWWWFDIARCMRKWRSKLEGSTNDPLDFGTRASNFE